jgi:hypothetical protein
MCNCVIYILKHCDRSAEDAHSSMAPDPTFAFVGGPWCPTLDFVIAFWIMIYISHIVNFAILYCIHIQDVLQYMSHI